MFVANPDGETSAVLPSMLLKRLTTRMKATERYVEALGAALLNQRVIVKFVDDRLLAPAMYGALRRNLILNLCPKTKHMYWSKWCAGGAVSCKPPWHYVLHNLHDLIVHEIAHEFEPWHGQRFINAMSYVAARMADVMASRFEPLAQFKAFVEQNRMAVR